MVQNIVEHSLLLLKAPFLMTKLKRNQRLEPSELRKFQDKRLRAMIEHSYKNVAYYHSLFKKANLSYSDIKTIDDLEKIPITRKEDIIDLPQQSLTAINVDPNRCLKSQDLWHQHRGPHANLLAEEPQANKIFAILSVAIELW